MILLAATPPQWVEDALAHWRTLLNDHANCEKKAASTALALMFAYPEDGELVFALSRLAREELRHFEQVQRAMRALGVQFERQRPSQYAQALRQALRTSGTARKLDLLLAGALIEARSAERFALLAPRLPAPLSRLYADLGTAEARHYEMYIEFAAARDPQHWRARLAQLASCEAQAALLPGRELRFHSGPLTRAPS